MIEFLCFFLSLVAHDFHLSKLELNYDSKDQSIEMILNLFIDDLEDALEGEFGERLVLFEDASVEQEENRRIHEYLRDRLIIDVNGKIVEYEILGKEMSDDFTATYIYLEIPNIEDLQSITFENTVMLELFDDQMNIVQTKDSGKNGEFIRMDKKRTRAEWIP